MTPGAEPTIAVLIPTLNEAQRIGRCLDELVTLGFREIIVSDGGSSDGTLAIAAARRDVRVISGTRGRGSQLGAALRLSSAPVVLMLHADTQLPRDAGSLIGLAMADPAVAGGCFRLRFDRETPLLACCGWLTRFETPFTTFGDQAIFARRSALDAAGGIPDWPLLEDVELRRRLRRQGAFVKLSDPVITSARRFERRGIIRCQLVNLLIVAAYWLGLSPHWLATRYYSERS